MICPKCGKDVGDYKYCPDCGVPTIEVDAPAQSSPEPLITDSAPDVSAKKKVLSLNRFFAVVAVLQLAATLCLPLLAYHSHYSSITMAAWALHLIGIVLTLVFSRYVKFWMLFPVTVSGIALAIGFFIGSGVLNGCTLFAFFPLLIIGAICAILLPISKIPHKEDE